MAKAKTEDELKKAAEEAAAKSLKDMTDLQAAVKTQADENAKLLRGMQALAGVVKTQKDSLDKMTSSFEDLSTRSANQDKPGSSDANQDVEALSRKEFLQDVILPQIGNIFDEKLKGISEKLENVSSDFESKNIRDEVKALQGNRSDFNDWKGEIAAELKKNSALSVEDAYLLARTRDPDKARKIDDDLATKAKEEAAKKAAEQGGNFGGMRPSGGGDIEERDDMDEGEAAEKAWEDVEESLGGKAELDKALGIDTL